MTNILLINEDYVKSNSNISDNAWGKYLLPAIREAQDIYLQPILGANLYQAILDMVTSGTLSDNYKHLVDEFVQPTLLYQTLSNAIDVIDVKLVNLGTVRNRDEYVDNISDAERDRLKSSYTFKADFYARRLQEFLLGNRDLFPELDDCACNNMRANLASAASTGLWLGGRRNLICW